MQRVVEDRSQTTVPFILTQRLKIGGQGYSVLLIVGYHTRISSLLYKKWQEYRIEGWAGYCLKEKLKLMKLDLK